MTNYEEENRGTYQNRDFARQIVSFEGMKFVGSTGVENVTPTDVDGFIQLDNENAFIFFEIKHGEATVPTGQAKALMRTVDAIARGGGNAILFIATHNCESEDVIAGETIVDRYYTDNSWTRRGSYEVTLKQCVDNYINILHRNKEEKTA